MKLDGIDIFLIVSLTLVLVWLIIGHINYFNHLKTVRMIRDRVNGILQKEVQYKDTSERANQFIEREKLKEEYPELFEAAKKLDKDEKQYKKGIYYVFLLYGPIYNFF